MNDQANLDHDRADEDILGYTVSDEALETAAGAERGVLNTFPFSLCCDFADGAATHCDQSG